MTRKTRVLFSIFTLLAILTLLTGLFSPLGTVQARDGGSLPISPAGKITDKTPTYKWYYIATATKYEYELYKGATKIYTKTAWPASCGTTYCTHTPTTTLALASYKWRIRYYIGTTAQSWSVWKYFQVVPPPKDFDSQFNGSMAGWVPQVGGAWYVNSTSLYTQGAKDAWSSIYNGTSPVFANFDYLTRVRNNSVYPTCLAVRMGSSFFAVSNVNLGYPGYIFCIRNDGKYSIWYTDSAGAHTIQDWTGTSAIVTYDWNNLRVVAIGPFFSFYINKDLLYVGKDTHFTKGSVGITGSKIGSTSILLEVDYAKLRVLFANSPLPTDTISPEQQALNEAAMKGSPEPLIP